MKTLSKTTAVVLSGTALLIAAAAAAPAMAEAGPCSDARTNGAVLGGVAGAVLGNSVSGHNRGAGTLIGALLGAAVGTEVGQSTNSCTYRPYAANYQPGGYVTRTETVYGPAAYAPPPPPPPPVVYTQQTTYVSRGGWDDGDNGVYPQFSGIENHIRREVMHGTRDGDLSWDEGRDLLGQLRGIQGMERREFAFHGWNLPYDDAARIQARLDQLDQRVDWLRDNG